MKFTNSTPVATTMKPKAVGCSDGAETTASASTSTGMK